MRQVGDRLGRYTLLKRLAVGGMGEVFVAAKPGPVGFGPYVALKILRDELAGDQQFVDMLVDEANISMFLNHQNVVSVLDLSEDEGSYYIAMEYVQGITVERLVDALVSGGETLELPHTLYIAVELCRALKYAHTRVNHTGEPLNIVHRDVTPANILLSIQGEVKLTDFGIARARGRIHQTQAGVLKGKFGYMAPEMVRYERIDGRADLFCAGVVMYLMMSGRHPVAGAAVMEAIQRFEQKRIPPPSHFNSQIPTSLDTIVMRALEPQPDQRWGSAAALGDALRDVMLQNPEWRKHTKDGGQRLARIIRKIAPQEFDAPVPPDLLAKLLAEAPQESDVPAPLVGVGAAVGVGGTPAPLFGSTPAPQLADSGAATPAPNGSAHPGAVSGDGGAAPEVETDEQISVKEVVAAQDELSRARGASAVADLLDDADSGMATAASPVADGSLLVGFPSSSDRNRVSADLLAEPALPADDGQPTGETALPGPQGTVADKTEYVEYDYDEGVIDRPLRADTDRDDRTVVNPPADDPSESGVVLSVPTQPDEPDRDGQTVAGVFMPPREDSPAEVSSNPSIPAVLDASADEPLEVDDDPSTVVPLFTGETDQQSPMAIPGTDSEVVADATLLDGIDARMVRAAMARTPSDPDSSMEITQAGAPGLDAETIEAEPDELGQGAFDRLLSNATANETERSIDGLLSAAPRRAGSAAPIRVVMGPDGEVSRVEESDIAAPLDPALMPQAGRVETVEPAASVNPASVELTDGGSGRPSLEPRPLVWTGPEGSTERPPASGPPAFPMRHGSGDMGANTGRWIKGEIAADALAWDDDAAARRAVATRDRATPQYGAPRPTPQPGEWGAPPPPVSPTHPPVPVTFWDRNGMLVGTMLVALVLLSGLVYAILFTQVFWPRLKLSSEPPGAVVLVDGVQAPERTPLVVQVEPERRHRIEFRLEGYQRTLREITEGIGRAKTYTLSVALDRLPPKIFLPVVGEVSLNGQVVGRGREVSLRNLRRFKGAITLRVEAKGHEPYEVLFGAAAEIPDSLDVPLRKKSNK